MPLSNDFKAKIKAGNVKEALEMALAEAVELKVTTWVAQDSKDHEVEASPSQRLETRINLLSNEIATEIGEQFADGGIYSQLKVFHQEQVNQSHRLIQNNINCLQRLLNLWGRLDPQIAASLPAFEETLPLANQPLSIDDEENEPLPPSTPVVASSVAETPVISLTETAPNPVQTEDSDSGINIPGIAAVAGVGMLGMNLYANQQESDRSEPTQSLPDLEVPAPELQLTADLESSTLGNEDLSSELVSDLNNEAIISSSSAEIPPNLLEEQPLETSSFLDPFTDTIPASSSTESFEEANQSNWEMETLSQAEIPTLENFEEAEIPSVEAPSNWEMETLSQAEIPTLENFEEAEIPSVEAPPNWEMETLSQAEIPTLENFEELGETSDIDLVSQEDRGIPLTGITEDTSTEIAPPQLDTWMKSDLDLPSATRFFSDHEVEPETQSQITEEIDLFAPSPVLNIDNLPTATTNEIYGVDSIESFDDLATSPVEIFTETPDEEIEEVQAIATPNLDNPFDLAATSSLQPETWETETPATPDPVEESFNLSGAGVLGGIGMASLVANQPDPQEEGVTALPIDDLSALSSEDNISEEYNSISSLDELVFTEDPTIPELESAPSFNYEESFGLSESPNLETWDLPQEAIAPVIDDTQMPDWSLETISQSSTEAQSVTPEAELASWDMADLSANTDWDAASLELGLNDEPELLVAETNNSMDLDVLDVENDLNTWEIESSLSSDSKLNQELDDLITGEEIKNSDLDLSTPEIWDNWTEEESIDDSVAGLAQLSNDTAPIDLASLDLDDESWELPNDGDKWADPFADSNLDGMNDWQLIKPEPIPPAINSAADDLDLFLNSPESGKFATDPKNISSPENLSLDEDLSQWGNDSDPFADIFSMESSDTEKQK